MSTMFYYIVIERHPHNIQCKSNGTESTGPSQPDPAKSQDGEQKKGKSRGKGEKGKGKDLKGKKAAFMEWCKGKDLGISIASRPLG